MSSRKSIEDHLAAVEEDLHVHELHAEFVLGNARAAMLEGLLGQRLVLGHGLHVLFVGQPIDGLVAVGLAALVFLRRLLGEDHLAKTHALVGFDDDALALAHHERAGTEIIHLTVIVELDTKNLAHGFVP